MTVFLGKNSKNIQIIRLLFFIFLDNNYFNFCATGK